MSVVCVWCGEVQKQEPSANTSILAVHIQPREDTDGKVANADGQLKDLVEFHKAFGLKSDCFLFAEVIHSRRHLYKHTVFLSAIPWDFSNVHLFSLR